MARIRTWRVPRNYSSADWFEEAGQIAQIAAVQAVDTYREGRGVPVAHFIYSRVLAAVFTRYRQECAYSRRFRPFLAPDASSGGDTLRHDDPPVCSQTSSAAPAEDVDLSDQLDHLPRDLRLPLELVLLAEFTEEDAAAVLHVTRATLHRRKTKAISLLRPQQLN